MAQDGRNRPGPYLDPHQPIEVYAGGWGLFSPVHGTARKKEVGLSRNCITRPPKFCGGRFASLRGAVGQRDVDGADGAWTVIERIGETRSQALASCAARAFLERMYQNCGQTPEDDGGGGG